MERLEATGSKRGHEAGGMVIRALPSELVDDRREVLLNTVVPEVLVCPFEKSSRLNLSRRNICRAWNPMIVRGCGYAVAVSSSEWKQQ